MPFFQWLEHLLAGKKEELPERGQVWASKNGRRIAVVIFSSNSEIRFKFVCDMSIDMRELPEAILSSSARMDTMTSQWFKNDYEPKMKNGEIVSIDLYIDEDE